jgi:uncharacterized protein (TIGR03492 family)
VKRLLVLSNGAGEDSIACKILQKLPQDLRSLVVCCPLVGSGHAFEDRFEIVGPRVSPPSEGLFRESWRLAIRDLASGVIGGHLRQLSFLRRNRADIGLAVAVGDLFPVLWAGLGGMKRVMFVGTAKSEFHHPYSALERLLLRILVDRSVVRDGATAQRLMEHGIKAQWFGNAMMDEVQPQGHALPFVTGRPVITLFPGSRAQAPGVLAYQLEVLELVRLSHPDIEVGVALAPGTHCSDLVLCAERQGWRMEAGTGPHHPGTLRRGEAWVHLLSGVLGDLLQASSLALGQAGTANEQAAGAGVPVVAYDPRGEKGLRWYRKRQKGLLGDAVSVVQEDQAIIASQLQLLLNNSQERERRAEIGRERMGPPGGCQRMADAIADMWLARR